MPRVPSFAATLCCAALLAAAAHAAPAKGGAAATLTPGPASAPAGSVVRVPVAIDLNGAAPDTLILRFAIDPARATLAGVRVGPAAAGRAVDFQATPGGGTVVVFGGGGAPFTDGGEIFALVLALNAGAAGDNAAITDAGSEGANLAAQPVDVAIAPGSVAIGPNTGHHSADSNQDWRLSLSELLRVIQFYNIGALSCGNATEDGYAPGPGPQGCAPHDSDYAPQDWAVNLSELLRLIQLYNADIAYSAAEGTEDGYAIGPF